MSLELVLGWSLVHSLWELAAIGLSLLLFLLAARRAPAQVRYSVALLAMLACFAAPLITGAVLGRAFQEQLRPVATTLKSAPSKQETAHRLEIAGFPSEVPQDISRQIESLLPIIVRIWLVGLALMCLRLLGGLIGVRRLRGSGYPDEERRLQTTALAIAERLKLRRPFKLLLSQRVEVPTVIGAFRSVILLPASLTLKLPSAQVEALLAHEIAHIRRYDYLVNLLQSAVEAVLFYHPAVWWISSVVRREREHCCDDIAIEALGDRSGYTKALISLEEARSARLALAANGSGLLARVRRIAGVSQGKLRPRSSILTAFAVALVPLGLLSQTGFAKQSPVAATIEVKGQVVSATGKPVAGAVVECTSLQGIQVPAQHQRQTTGPDGRYDFKVEKYATWYVTAGSPRYGVGWTSDPVLRLAPPHEALVQVVDRSGRPVGNLKLAPTQVEADGRGASLDDLTDLYSFTTDNFGLARLTGLPANCKARFEVLDGPYTIDRSPDYLSAAKGSISRIVVQPASSLSGTVTADGNPVSGAAITVYSEQKPVDCHATSDAQGRFKVEAFPAGPAVIQAYVSKEWTVTPQKLFVSRDKPNTVELTAHKTGTVNGQVFDEAGKPLSKTYLLIYKGTPFDHTNVASANSHEDGSFSVNLPPGSYEAMAITDKARGTQNFTVRTDETTSMTLRVPHPSRQLSPPTLNLRCRFVDPNGRTVHWRSFWYEFQAGGLNTVGLCTARDQEITECSVPADATKLRFADKEWESDKLSWRPDETITVRFHRKTKANR